jgi:hypothetical protein
MEAEKKEGFTDYKATIRKGYLGDFGHEWWTEADWENHRQYVEEIKATGEYGKEVEITIRLKDNPIFDQPKPFSFESSRMIFIDTEKYNPEQ